MAASFKVIDNDTLEVSLLETVVCTLISHVVNKVFCLWYEATYFKPASRRIFCGIFPALVWHSKCVKRKRVTFIVNLINKYVVFKCQDLEITYVDPNTRTSIPILRLNILNNLSEFNLSKSLINLLVSLKFLAGGIRI